MEEPGDSKIAPELSNKLALCLLRASREKEEPSEYNKRTPPIIIEWINYTAEGVKAVKLIITLILLLLTSGTSNGAVSGDMSEYVRKDVYDVQMRTMDAKLDMILDGMKEMREELKSQRKDINELTNAVSVMSERIDRNFETLSARIDGLDARMGDLRNDIYLGLVILGIMVGVPSVQKWYERLRALRPSVTLEDVKRLIAENNAELLKTLRT